MSPDHEAWFRKADEDLMVIENSLQVGRVPWPQMSFHAQQLAEKYLKGFLVFHEVLPPKTHDLDRLLKLAAKHDATLSAFAEDCAKLTQIGFQSRYPGVNADALYGRWGSAMVRKASDVRDVLERERVNA